MKIDKKKFFITWLLLATYVSVTAVNFLIYIYTTTNTTENANDQIRLVTDELSSRNNEALEQQDNIRLLIDEMRYLQDKHSGVSRAPFKRTLTNR